MVMAAYAYYKAGKYPEAQAAGKRYTTMHPGTKDAALAHHIVASANFDEIKEPHRDQTATRKALGELKLLVQRYPDSPYTKQAINRVRIAEDVLAASEMNVGRYYLNRQNYVGAINRFKTVVSDYQTTVHVEEALYRICEANMTLGIVPEAQAAGAVLGHNFPNSDWYKRSYALLKSGGVSPQIGGNSWFTKTLKSLTPGSKKAPEPEPKAPGPGQPSPDAMPPAKGDVPTAKGPERAAALRLDAAAAASADNTPQGMVFSCLWRQSRRHENHRVEQAGRGPDTSPRRRRSSSAWPATSPTTISSTTARTLLRSRTRNTTNCVRATPP